MPALSDWYINSWNKFGHDYAEKLLSKVQVVKSKRWYNDTSRLLPGAVIIYDNTRYILRGRISSGKYYTVVGYSKNLSAKDCVVISHKSLVYI